MPELPEVEVLRQRLKTSLIGRRITALSTTGKSYLFLTSPRELERRLVGRTALALERHGKYLLLELDDGSRLLIHLGMTGQLFAAGATSPRLLSAKHHLTLDKARQAQFEPDGHTHLRVSFSDGGPQLFFRDVRKFGKLLWLAQGRSDSRLDKLGPDALTADFASWASAAARRRGSIKAFLLDQSVVAGIGNIYADESLFSARLLPTRKVEQLSRAELHRLHRAVAEILAAAIVAGGSSIDDYIHPDGSDGDYQLRLSVYGRTGQPCRRCKGAIERSLVAQRGTHFCASCQR